MKKCKENLSAAAGKKKKKLTMAKNARIKY